MDTQPDPLQTQLRRALRAGLGGVAARPGVSGAPVDDGPASPAAQVLGELGALLYEPPPAAGGMELGLMAGVTVSEELGRAACGNPYRAAALAADAALVAGRPDVLDRLLAGTTVSAAGLDALPTGRGVTVRAGDRGWELTGTVTADAADADLLAVPCQPGAPAATDPGGPAALALISSAAPGRKAVGGWPYLVQLCDVTVTRDDVLPGLTAGPLARAQVRQAAYLHGLASGMLEAAVAYTGRRRQFGGRLRDLQAVSFPLARAVVALRAARMSICHAAWQIDTGQPAGHPDRPSGHPAQPPGHPDRPSGHAAQPSGYTGPPPGDARHAGGTAPAEALAASAEALTGVARVTMQACGVRAMTPELPLHRYYRLAAAETARYGRPAALWQAAGAARLARHIHN